MSSITLTSAWLEDQNALLSQLSEADQASRSLESALANNGDWASVLHSLFRSLLDRTADVPPADLLQSAWKFTCNLLRFYSTARRNFRRVLLCWIGLPLVDPDVRRWVTEVNQRFTDLAELVQTVLINRPDLNLTLPTDLEEVVWTIRISPLAYLRAMWNLFWSAIRHPLSETTIDLSTGRVLYRT